VSVQILAKIERGKIKKNRVVFISMSNLTLKLVAAGASVYLSGEALLASLTYDEK
jgi:hypothetical protein